MARTQNISLRTRWLGESLRNERAKTDYTLRDAAEFVGIDFTTLGRFERGTHRIKEPYLRALLDFYGVSSPKVRQRLLKLNEDSWKRDWWDSDYRDLEAGFIDYTWLESRAAKISHFETTQIPGILQVPEYARSVMRESVPYNGSQDEVERSLELRVKRQSVINGDTMTPLTLVLIEGALRRRVGETLTMRTQFDHLLRMSEEPHIEIRIYPDAAHWHPALGTAFTYFEMQHPYPSVVYTENFAGRTFLEDHTKVDQFRGAYDELRNSAMSTEATTQHLRELLKDFQ